MDVTFESCTGTRFTIEIGFFDTVLEIKEKIQKYQGFPVSKQTLLFNGRVLADDHDTEFYEILEGSHLQLFLESEPTKTIKTEDASSSGKFEIMVKLSATRKLPLEVHVSDTVGHLKECIHKKVEGIPVNRMVLLVSDSGTEMKDHWPLGEYGICEHSEIGVSLKPVNPATPAVSVSSNKLRLVVQNTTGDEKISLEMNASDTVEEVKRKLHRIHNIPSKGYFFVYEQNVMDDNRTLRAHDVRDGDTLFIFEGSISDGSEMS